MRGNDIRKKFLDFMQKNGHAIIPSSALVPENDPTTLFTGSGMQPLVPYLMGEKHPMGVRLADSQKCFRSDDIEEVGDNRHTTFFEMLGNWSLGDYFKETQLPQFYNFLTKEIGLNPEHIYVTAFAGDSANNVPKDTESVALWETLFKTDGVSHSVAHMGSEQEGSERGMKEGERIFFYDASKNWWSRSGRPEKMPLGEIGGPDSEVFYDFGTKHDTKFGAHCHPNCDCGRFLEIGNSVFIEYVKTEKGFEKLPQQNVDFGGGLERIAAASNGDADMFKIDLLYSVISEIEKLSGKKYEENHIPFRIIADHIRGAVFMIGDGVLPTNTDQGYFVRRLFRRAVRYCDVLDIKEGGLTNVATIVIDLYKTHYPVLFEKQALIMNAIQDEEIQFRKTLKNGLKEFNKVAVNLNVAIKNVDGKMVVDKTKPMTQQMYITGKNAFNLFTTYGFPIELTVEIAKERKMKVAVEEFNELMKEHRELSRAGSEQKFKGGLADSSDAVVAYHTATHLLLSGLRKELGTGVHQAGSNITGERLRFDFTYPERVEPEVLAHVEAYVNEAIKKGAHVVLEKMAKKDAESDPSIEGSFWERYPDEVLVYTIRDNDGVVYSRELCGGPHVENTSEIKGTFKIVKEESSSKGVRRIKAVLA